MNKMEFLSKVEQVNSKFTNATISDADYKTIEYVYTWHPCIDAVRGKEQIAYLFCEFGMRVINDMCQTAILAQEAEQKMLKAKAEYERAAEEYQKLKKGSK